jgi:hypothetical protein
MSPHTLSLIQNKRYVHFFYFHKGQLYNYKKDNKNFLIFLFQFNIIQNKYLQSSFFKTLTTYSEFNTKVISTKQMESKLTVFCVNLEFRKNIKSKAKIFFQSKFFS